MAKKITIELTAKQAEALLWAIDLTETSFEGWSNAEKGNEVIRDLCRLEDIYNAIAIKTN
jgi:hypothetical protein